MSLVQEQQTSRYNNPEAAVEILDLIRRMHPSYIELIRRMPKVITADDIGNYLTGFAEMGLISRKDIVRPGKDGRPGRFDTRYYLTAQGVDFLGLCLKLEFNFLFGGPQKHRSRQS